MTDKQNKSGIKGIRTLKIYRTKIYYFTKISKKAGLGNLVKYYRQKYINDEYK